MRSRELSRVGQGLFPESKRAIDWPTIWGLQPSDIHERFWAARGIQVVRQGSSANVGAELYLLAGPSLLLIFRVAQLVDLLSWTRPRILYVRLNSSREKGYREEVQTDAERRFLRFERFYYQGESRAARVALTSDLSLARVWQNASSPREAWRRLREKITRRDRSIVSVRGHVFDESVDRQVMQFIHKIIGTWHRPDSTVCNLREVDRGVWAHESARIESGTTFVGPVWIGAERRLTKESIAVGPAVLWDDPGSRPEIAEVEWHEIEPRASLRRPAGAERSNRMGRAGKRAFDILFSLCALAFTLPFYPLIMLFIWAEDGRPFFFSQRRESLGGREFWCLKFRSMWRDAEKMKAELLDKNQVDGPQFFIEKDPRLTRVGRFLRKMKI